MAASALPAAAGSFTARRAAGWAARLYVPSTYRQGVPMPLLVMLHGCTQTPDDFAAGTRMNSYAEQHGCLVLYPQQRRRNNPRRCWNWFSPRHQVRGHGEPAAIAAMVGSVRQEYTVAADRIYIAGISAGAAMAVVLAATYPDIFAAVGTVAGVAYKGATSVRQAYRVLAHGVPNPRLCGNDALRAMGQQRRPLSLVVVQGTADPRVAPVNAAHLLAQWHQTNRMAAGTGPDSAVLPPPESVQHHAPPQGLPSAEYTYRSAGGSVFKQYMVEGLAHAWPGGSSQGSYTDPRGPDASRLLVEFFLQHAMPAVPAVVAPPLVPVETAPPQPPAPAQARPPGIVRRAWHRLVRFARSVMGRN
jgi:poly(hydroxyalkanoate) depolymerase family esterase